MLYTCPHQAATWLLPKLGQGQLGLVTVSVKDKVRVRDKVWVG
jgi:hypothetical protein